MDDFHTADVDLFYMMTFVWLQKEFSRLFLKQALVQILF